MGWGEAKLNLQAVWPKWEQAIKLEEMQKAPAKIVIPNITLQARSHFRSREMNE